MNCRVAIAAIASSVLAAVACAVGRPEDASSAILIEAEFAETFWIGDDGAEREFAEITAVAFAPNGHLVVMDMGESAVTVMDTDGNEVARWGGKGEGPGEFAHTLGTLAVSGAAIVAVDNKRRVDMFTLEGTPLGSHPVGESFYDLAFDSAGNVVVLAWPTGAPAANQELPTRVIQVVGGRELWVSGPLPPLNAYQVYGPHGVLSDLGGGRIAIGLSNEYDMAVLDASTGRELGRISRDIPLRATPEEYVARIRESMPSVANVLTFGETLPVVGKAFTGPPGNTVWVRRRGGVGDTVAAPVDEEHRLYDLFDGQDYEYIGTVEAPEGLTLLAGDETRVAGVHKDELDVPSVRVLRVELEG